MGFKGLEISRLPAQSSSITQGKWGWASPDWTGQEGHSAGRHGYSLQLGLVVLALPTSAFPTHLVCPTFETQGPSLPQFLQAGRRGLTKRPLHSKQALTTVCGAGSHPSAGSGGVGSIGRLYIIAWDLAASYVRQTACKCVLTEARKKHSENSFMLISLIHRKLGEMLCNDNSPPPAPSLRGARR